MYVRVVLYMRRDGPSPMKAEVSLPPTSYLAARGNVGEIALGKSGRMLRGTEGWTGALMQDLGYGRFG
jgi:hypothetical protein